MVVAFGYLEVTALTAGLSFEAFPDSEELLNIDGVQQVGVVERRTLAFSAAGALRNELLR
jgi:hypothetical protein